MEESSKIPGGYILIARKIFKSELMDKPPHYLKLWVWMLGKANWKDRDKLKRGQFLTTIAEMQEAGGYYIGARHRLLTRDEVRSAYEAFSKATMITTAKTTRGMIITILNYLYYQQPENYETHGEPLAENTPKPTATPHDTEEGLKKENIYSDFFEKLWAVYPSKDGKKEALRHFKASVKSEQDCDLINLALGNYLEHLSQNNWKQPKNGRTWFNNWRDWIPEAIDGQDTAA